MTSAEQRSGQVFDLTGGRLSLDFANTSCHRSTRPKEQLASYADLVSFARQAGIVNPDRADVEVLPPAIHGQSDTTV